MTEHADRSPGPAATGGAPAELQELVRDGLAGRDDVVEKRMFGGVAFMVGGRLAVWAGRERGLLVRVDPDRSTELLARPGAAQAVMGERSMGPGWVAVAADDAAADLQRWLADALDHNERARAAG